MNVVGPVLVRARGYAFDTWEPAAGLRQGFVYPRFEDARYARRVALSAGPAVSCDTDAQFKSLAGA